MNAIAIQRRGGLLSKMAALAVETWRDFVALMASLVVNTGLANITAAWHAYTTRALYIGWGTGSGQTATSTTLSAAAAESRTTGTSSQQTTNTASDTYRVVGTVVATAGRAITEAALFDASTSGNMCVYGDFSVINLLTNDSIAFTFNVVLDQG